MPQVPGTKVWLRKGELDTICRAIEVSPPMGRLPIAYEYALVNVRRAKQALSNTNRVKTFVIWWWFNFGWDGKKLDLKRFLEVT